MLWGTRLLGCQYHYVPQAPSLQALPPSTCEIVEAIPTGAMLTYHQVCPQASRAHLPPSHQYKMRPVPKHIPWEFQFHWC